MLSLSHSGTGDLPGLLLSRGLDPARILALRISLNPADAGDGFHSTADLVRTGTIDLYARMHDGQRLGAEADVLVFAAEAGGMARLRSFSTYRARRRGIAPGDIVYDYEAAHLLHSFISRARHPTFYDAFERDGMAEFYGHLVVEWPKPMMRNLRRAQDSPRDQAGKSI